MSVEESDVRALLNLCASLQARDETQLLGTITKYVSILSISFSCEGNFFLAKTYSIIVAAPATHTDACPSLSLPVHAGPCLSLLVPACPGLSLPVPVCLCKKGLELRAPAPFLCLG